MAKRLLDLFNEESELRKKIKLENEIISNILIFHLLMETVISEESLDNTDGIVSDTILKIVLKISEFLKNNTDSRKIPEIFKIALKKMKSLFNLQTDQNAEHTGESEKASETSRDGSEEHNRRVRNRRFKIKWMMEQPRNVEVKQNGRVICTMVVTKLSILAWPEETTIKNKQWLFIFQILLSLVSSRFSDFMSSGR